MESGSRGFWRIALGSPKLLNETEADRAVTCIRQVTTCIMQVEWLKSSHEQRGSNPAQNTGAQELACRRLSGALPATEPRRTQLSTGPVARCARLRAPWTWSATSG